MARQRSPVTVNQFIGGINTEASILNYPAESSSDEQNMDINDDGSRSRRFGIDVEDSYVAINTGVAISGTETAGRSQYLWTNVAGNSDEQFVVVQIGNYIGVHRSTGGTISSQRVYWRTFDASTYSNNYTYSDVNNQLVIATGLPDITILTYENGVITSTSKRLLVRDFWGVEAVASGSNLTTPNNISLRPPLLTSTHVYNLRNQTWSLPRMIDNDTNAIIDPISQFAGYSNFIGRTDRYPSNSDSVIPYLQANATIDSDRTTERFVDRSAVQEKPDNTPAPRGYFIIDALDRGSSRLEQEQRLRSRNPELSAVVNNLPQDQTPGGVSVTTEYAGRVWYAGFSGEVVNGDSKSPSLSSYILFSRFVEDLSQINQCYQEADPTSNVDAAIVDTDGGFVKISGANNITALVSLGSSLFVLAENGVWRVSGTEQDSFTATGFSVDKIYSEGCVSSNSVVVANNAIFFWGLSSIFAITRNEVGEWSVNDLTETTIASIYNDIPNRDKKISSGHYDDETNTIRWVYNRSLVEEGTGTEILFNTKFNAFSKIAYDFEDTGVKSISSVGSSGTKDVPIDNVEDVTVNSVVVTVNGEDVDLATSGVALGGTSPIYCTILGQTSSHDTIFHYTFSEFQDDTYSDWDTLGSPSTTQAYIQTGPITAGEPRLRKDSPYLTMFFEKVDNTSCLMRAIWDWTDDFISYKWSNPRQTYRPPSRIDGQTVVKTRNRVRGSGNSVSFLLESEDANPLHIYGWAFNLQSTTEE